MNQSFYIGSGRGGTGKSVFAVNLAATFAMLGRNTLLVDMNPGMRSLDIMLDVEYEAIYHVFDVMNGICQLEQAVIRIENPSNLYLLPGGLLEDREQLNSGKWKKFLGETGEIYDCIIVDGAPGADCFVTDCASACDETLVVVTPELTALRNGDMLEDQLIRKRVLRRRFIINRMKPELVERGLETEASDINRQFKCEMLGMILEDDNFRFSTDAGIPVVLKEKTYIAENFRKIAGRLMNSR